MTGWLMLADRLTDAWAGAMWRACWQGGLALAVVWMWCRLVAPRRTPAKVKCWLWRLAYAKLLVSLVWIAPAALPLLPAHPEPPSPEPPSPAPTVVHINPAAERQTAGLLLKNPSDTPLFDPSVPALAHVPQSAAGAPKWHPWRAALACLWLIGTALAVLRLAAGWRATVSLRRRCTLVDDAELLERFAALACRYGLRRAPPVMQADGIASPLLLGVRRPWIVLPTGLASSHAPGELRLMLAHELAHLRRRDLLWNALAAAAQAVFWFHPLVWLARREWRLAQEVACNEAAVAVTRARTADYARALLGIVERCAEPGAAGPRLVAVGVFENGRTIERRLVAMKHYQNWTGRRRMLAACAIACAAVVGVPSWRLVAKETPPREDAAAEKKSGTERASPRDVAAEAPADHDRAATRPAGAATDTITVPGRIGARTISIRALSGGRIRATRLEDGQRVKQGELLIQLDNDVDVAQILAAEADLKAKTAAQRRTLELFRELVQRGSSNAEIDEARANVEIAQVALKYRQALLAQHRITAPFDGVIVNAKAQVGQVVSGGEGVLATLVDLDHPIVEFSVTEKLSTVVERGAKVKVTVPALEKDFTGQVAVVADEIDPGTATARVKATLDGPIAGLKPGMFARVALARPGGWSEREGRH